MKECIHIRNAAVNIEEPILPIWGPSFGNTHVCIEHHIHSGMFYTTESEAINSTSISAYA